MYEYWKLTPTQRAELVQQRLTQGFPPHSPPHTIRDRSFYIITAACYQHRSHINTPSRRQQLLEKLFENFRNRDVEILAWVILPNHYHLLIKPSDFSNVGQSISLVHGSLSRQWNLENNSTGSKIWYQYYDRAIRSEGHYYATLNYIHYNPVKHGWAKSPYEWEASSVYWYLEHYGRQWLRDLWVSYPVLDYGKGWDD